MDSVQQAQEDMRSAYILGVPGIVCSASAWMAAAMLALFVSGKAGVATLVLGGMFIFPASVLLCKLFGRTGKHQKSNPLAALALEGTFWMLLSIPLALGLALYRIEWFFPAMLLVIAGRYLTFSTLYGLRIYWVFAVVLAVAAFVALGAHASVFIGALLGALVEYLFALIIFMSCRSYSGQGSAI